MPLDLLTNPAIFNMELLLMSIFLEIGPGRGDFLFWLAEQNPTDTVIAVEYKRKRFEKLKARTEKRGFKNVWLYLGDARQVLTQEFTDSCIDKIYILFSDPWPKRRHEHHRLFQQDFVKQIHRILTPGGRIFIAHDDPVYTAAIRELFREKATLFIAHEEPLPFAEMTFYAEKWKKEGRKIQSFSYEKNAIDRPTSPL